MKTYKIYWTMNTSLTGKYPSGETLMRGNSEQEVRDIFEDEHQLKDINDIVDTSTEEYQSAYDSEQFDSNGRRKF